MSDKKQAEGQKVGAFPLRFFRTIFGGYLVEQGLELEVRCIHSNSDKPVVRRFYKSLSELKKSWQEIVKLNHQHYDIYFGVVPRDAERS